MLDESRLTRRRGACILIALSTLLLGLYIYLAPDTLATLPAPARSSNPWPWPIGPLALRFIASLLLAAALGIFLVARRPDNPSLIALLSIVTITGALLLLHAIVNVRQIEWSKPLSLVWIGGLLLACLGSLTLVVRLRQQTQLTSPPLPATPPVANRIALFIFVLTGLVGGTMFLLPEFGLKRWPWNLGNLVNVQLFGALFLAVGLTSLWSWRQASWYGYDLFYPVAATFASLALMASFLHWNLFAARPITSWIFVGLYILGAVLGYYPYLRHSFRVYRQPITS